MTKARGTKRSTGQGILADPYLVAAIVLIVLVSIPLAAPGLDSVFWINHYPFYFDAPLLLLTCVALWSARRTASGKRSRAFWGYLATGFAFWLLVRVIDPVFPQTPPAATLTADLLYLGFYLCLILGFQLRPHRASQDTGDDLIRQLESTGATLFVFGLLVYFVIIPATYNPGALLTNIPSATLFVALNLYLFLRVFALRHSWRHGLWRQCYNCLVAATTGFVLLDSLDLASRINGKYDAPIQGTLVEALWLVPLVGFIAAARLYARSTSDARAAGTHENLEKLIFAWRGKLTYFALVPPVVHIALEFLGWADPLTRSPREILVVFWVLSAAGVSFLYDRRLLKQQQTLEARHRRINRQLEVTQRMDTAQRMAGGLAHDFNNLLMVIQGFADVLVSKLEASESRGDAEQIGKAARRAGELTKQLHAFGIKDKPTLQSFSPDEALAAMKPTLQQLVGVGLTLEMQLNDTGFVVGNRGAFEDAVLNLVLNARDASSEGGTIYVKSGRLVLSGNEHLADTLGPGCYGFISVEDNGMGMDEETRAHAFEPFFSLRDGGTGLGLSMVYSFASEGGGTVEVESTVGEGTVFRIILPEGVATEPACTAAPDQPHLSARSRTVLLVEDQNSVRSILKRLLQDAGFNVLEACGGAEALRMVQQQDDNRIDLVLTDVVMPSMDGGTLARRIREIDEDLPIIFMTGYAAGQLDRLGDMAQTSPILKKPFDAKELLAQIDRSLQKNESTV